MLVCRSAAIALLRSRLGSTSCGPTALEWAALASRQEGAFFNARLNRRQRQRQQERATFAAGGTMDGIVTTTDGTTTGPGAALPHGQPPFGGALFISAHHPAQSFPPMSNEPTLKPATSSYW